MDTRIVSQPETQLGNEISDLLNKDVAYTRIAFVSAFVALRTILRLRERLLEKMENGTRLRLTIGIDLGGTSRDVLDELLRWNCETFVFHNPFARATFHPKVYLFESETSATLFVASNNLTDGGFYTNYEAATRYDFEFPNDSTKYEQLVRPLAPFFENQTPTIQQLNAQLIEALVARGELPSEAEKRQHRRVQTRAQLRNCQNPPQNPFAPVAVPMPPLLSDMLRRSEAALAASPPQASPTMPQPLPPSTQSTGHPQNLQPMGVLVWRKTLPQTDALQVNASSHHVGGVRLTQAHFENPSGQRIDQTTYFRQLFANYSWEQEINRRQDQEHTFVPMRIIIRDIDYGVRNFEISHKPSGEAGQNNYTTILRWGREFNPTVLRENLTGTIFSLYEIAESDADFLIKITEAL